MAPSSVQKIRIVCLVLAISALAIAAAPPLAEAQNNKAVLYSEDFEDGGTGWSVTGGLWAVDTITSGPGAAHSGDRAAATNPHGGYPYYADSRLVSPEWDLPGGQTWLRFWHASSMGGHDQDRGRVQVSCNGGAWVTLPFSQVGDRGGNVWGQGFYDLSAYAGCTIRIAFWFTSDNTAGSSGWYIDDVSIEEGAAAFPATEDFEGGFGDFSVTSGLWEVGHPTYGPLSAHSGQNCVGTMLASTYPYYSSSRLVSPPMHLSAAPQDGQIWLRFWHASDMTVNGDGDKGRVQVSCDGGSWVTLPLATASAAGGNVWGQALYDLSTYADCTVQIAFWFSSDNTAGGSGWYIDDVGIEEGPPNINNPEDFDSEDPELWWRGDANWTATSGLWEVGPPLVGPSSAHSGSSCAGTILGGNYPIRTDSRFVTPEFELASNPLGGGIWLHFWQSHDFVGLDAGQGDTGRVQISCDGGAWENLPSPSVTLNGGAVWSPELHDLSAYAGCSARIAFWLTSDAVPGSWGWYLDDLGISEGQPTFRGSQEGFESGTGGWSTSNGAWEIGVPTSGPGAAYQGSTCAATALGGNYPGHADARLLTPAIVVSPVDVLEPTLLKFKHWYELYDDQGVVEISVDGGAWASTGMTFSGSGGGGWNSSVPFDLSPYSGSRVQFSFRLTSGLVDQRAGWYIDMVEFTNLDLEQPASPTNLSAEYYSPASTPPGDMVTHPILSWDPVADPDLAYYAIYRGIDEDFLPNFGSRIALVTGPTYIDRGAHGPYYHYKVASVDSRWNESVPVGPALVVAAPPQPDSTVSKAVWLSVNYPNPFNPSTTISWSVPAASDAKLEIFDSGGRRVVTLVDGRVDAGPGSVVWNGADVTGEQVSSGVYFYRLTAAEFTDTKRMVLIK